MKPNAKLFFTTMAISFLGSLPLGILNISVANFTSHDDLASAFGFSVAAIFVEMAFVRITLTAIKQFEKLKRYLRFFSLLTSFLLLMLSFNTLAAAYQSEPFHSDLPLSAGNPVLSGLLLSVMNPLHLPFWMSWIVLLKSNRLLNDKPSAYNYFICAIGIGTAAAFFLYGIAGSYVVRLFRSQQTGLNWVVGIILLVSALMLLYKNHIKTFYKL